MEGDIRWIGGDDVKGWGGVETVQEVGVAQVGQERCEHVLGCGQIFGRMF